MNGSKNGVASLLERFRKPEKLIKQPMPGVAICVPSGDMIHADFAASLVGIVAWCGPIQGMTAVPFAYLNCKGSLVVRNRNQLVEDARKVGAQYLLFVDSDMTFPPHTLRQLLGHNKDIVGCTYLQREQPHRILGVWKDGLELTTDKLHEVNALPLGCMLIKLSVFDEMVKPYFRTPAYEKDDLGEGRIQGEDFYFCDQADKLGFQVWLDAALSLQVGHVGSHVVKIEVQPQMTAEQVPAANEEVSSGQASVH